MRKLNEWAKGKPVGLVIMAQQLAIGAELCFELLKKIKAGDRIELFSSETLLKAVDEAGKNEESLNKRIAEKRARYHRAREKANRGRF